MTRSTKTFAVPPGEIIKDFIEPRHMTQRELAIRMNTSEKNLCLLLKGKAPVTPETAQKLEMVFDVPAATWLKMESEYRADLLKVKEELKTEGESEFVVRIGYSALSALGWVPKTKDISEKIINLRKFFEVADLNVICSEKFAVNVALRDARITEKSDLLALAWCQKACIEARQQELGVLNIRKLCSCLKELKPLASRATPDLDGMQQILNSCGIAMVILPPLDGSDIHSASFPYGKTVVMGLLTGGRQQMLSASISSVRLGTSSMETFTAGDI